MDTEDTAPGEALAATQPSTLAQQSEIGAMLHMAIEKGIDVETLERLQAMYERAQDRNARADFNAALSAFHSDCPVIGKGSVGKVTTRNGGGYEYSYASLDQIARTIRPVLAKHGLSYSWDSVQDGSTLAVTCTVRHIGGHSEKSTFSVPMQSPAGMSEQQKAGSALTYARRYSLTSALGLTTGDPDDDGAGNVGVPVPQERLSDERRGELLELASGLDEKEWDAFLEWLGVGALAELPAALYARAKAGLERKLASKKGAS